MSKPMHLHHWLALLLVCLGARQTRSQAPNANAPDTDAVAALQSSVVNAIKVADRSVVAFARGPANGKNEEPNIGGFVPHEYGTGVIVDQRGLILTNYHLLGEVQRSTYMVWHAGRVFFPAKVRAADPWTDLAILEVKAEEMTPIQWGDGSAVSKGQFVIALGNPYEIAHQGSAHATWGIVSNVSAKPQPNTDAADRETAYQHGGIIQTDARLRQGTSGGPLVNLQGEMIGLVTSLAALRGYAADASYAIPVDETFRRVIDRLKSGREAQFGFLGVDWDELTMSERQSGLHGVRLGRVYPASPALQHGLQSNDVVTHVGRQPVHDSNDLSRLISRQEPGAMVPISLRRSDPILRRMRTIQRNVTLAKKYIPSRRPKIVTVMDEPWRGIRVDYPSATADYRDLAPRLNPDGCVIVTEVDHESPGRQAGIRAGDLITHVQDEPVRTPAEFSAATTKSAGEVELRLITSDGRENVLVSAENVPK